MRYLLISAAIFFIQTSCLASESSEARKILFEKYKIDYKSGASFEDALENNKTEILKLIIQANEGLPFISAPLTYGNAPISNSRLFSKFIDDKNFDFIVLAAGLNDLVAEQTVVEISRKFSEHEGDCNINLHNWIFSNEKYISIYKNEIKFKGFARLGCEPIYHLLFKKIPEVSFELYSRINNKIDEKLSHENIGLVIHEAASVDRFNNDEGIVGIGFDNKGKISEVFKNTPAESAGLVADDRIISINGTKIEGKSDADLSGLFEGPIGTKFQIVVLNQEGEEQELLITKAAVVLDLDDLKELVKKIRDGGCLDLVENTKSWLEFIDLLNIYTDFMEKKCTKDHDGPACDISRKHQNKISIFKQVLQEFVDSYKKIKEQIPVVEKLIAERNKKESEDQKKRSQSADYFLKEACHALAVVKDSKKTLDRENAIGKTSGTQNYTLLHEAGSKIVDYQKRLDSFKKKYESKTKKKWSDALCR